MPRLPGKPCKVERKVVISAITKRKTDVLLPKNKIVSKLDPIWKTISNDLSNQLSARTLYSMMCRADVKREVSCSTPEANDVIHDESNPDLSVNTSVDHESSMDDRHDSIVFTVWADRIDFEGILDSRVYKRREITRGKNYNRYCAVLKPGVWQEWITGLIWDAQRLKCAFNFHNSKLTQDGSCGTLYGTCKCGGTISCKIDNSIELKDKTRIDCIAKRGQGQCGKRPLRAPMRKIIGKKLCTKSATIYHAEKANEMMSPGDSEPPHLYKKSALINAKHEYIASQYLDRDPIRAMVMLKLQSYQNAIHGIGIDPFFVHYWTNHQLHVYRTYAKHESACIAIDATGGIIKAIEKFDGSRSSHIFLYHCVIHSQYGQFSVSQMLSERHTTVTISHWLSEWVTQAAAYPKEVVCDSSKALLGAAVRVFTDHTTIEGYANACHNPTLPSCFIRIDVAHFIKMYSNFLKNSPKRVKVFYLAVLGQFIQSRDVNSAADLLESILMVARCETDGNLPCGQQTQCEYHKLQLKNTIDPRQEISDDIRDTEPTSYSDEDTIFDGNRFVNYWSSWAESIDLKVKRVSYSEEGDHDNAHYLPAFADRLISDIRWFPLWSSVCRDRFKYGRVPATSASVESEFNIIKTHLLKTEPTPMRADVFVPIHLDHINGRTKIIDARIMSSVDHDMEALDHLTELNDRNEDIVAPTVPSGHDMSPGVNVSPILNVFTSHDSRPNKNVPSAFDSAKTDIDRILREADEAIKFASPRLSPINLSADPDDSDVSTQTQDVPQVPLITVRPDKKIEQKLCSLCSMSMNDWSTTKAGTMVCSECSELDSTNKVLASRETEDWRGLSTANEKKKSRYLTRNHDTFDCISSERLSKIPIMKNGSNIELQASKLKKKSYSFTKTCPFDSIFHAILVAAYDRPAVKEAVHHLSSKNKLLHLVSDTLSRGLRSHSYKLRALILLDMHLAVQSHGDNFLVDCGCNVTHPACKLFRETPSFEDISICINGCKHSPRPHPTFNITEKELKDPYIFEKILNTVHNSLRNATCQSNGCDARVTKQFTTTGPFAMVELNDIDPLALSEIPKSFCDPLSDEYHFGLIGIIEFKPPAPTTRTRSSSDSAQDMGIGHYTAIILRPPKTWMEVDDTKHKPNKLSATFKTRPHMLIYFKERK